MHRTSRVQSKRNDDNNTFASAGATGNSAIWVPSGSTRRHSVSMAPRENNSSRARISASGDGGDTKSKCARSWMPMLSKYKATVARLVRCICGMVSLASLVRKCSCVQRRKHFPGRDRPARPARCFAEAFDTGAVSNASTPVSGLKKASFVKHPSTTNTTPSIVTEVSAIVVATITLRRTPRGAGENAFCCMCSGSVPYRGTGSK
ncbi:hypothetical protein ON010_g18925 [Phytophthora cinnamomi]|nr:hypothetical protein ON010_g18925 [Phytophthora cinnamomi]